MATITGVLTEVKTAPDVSWRATWPLLTTTNDVGSAIEYPAHSDRSVQVDGTFGAGGTVVIQGSNDGTNWYTLNDPQGNALSFTSSKIEAVMEITQYIRPKVTAGDGTTSLTVTMLMSGYRRW